MERPGYDHDGLVFEVQMIASDYLDTVLLAQIRQPVLQVLSDASRTVLLESGDSSGATTRPRAKCLTFKRC